MLLLTVMRLENYGLYIRPITICIKEILIEAEKQMMNIDMDSLPQTSSSVNPSLFLDRIIVASFVQSYAVMLSMFILFVAFHLPVQCLIYLSTDYILISFEKNFYCTSFIRSIFLLSHIVYYVNMSCFIEISIVSIS